MKTLFIPAESTEDALEVIKKKKFSGKIGLISTVQFLHQLEDIKKYLERNAEVFIGGQVLGCDVNNAVKIKDKVDYFLFIGSGEFHPIEVYKKCKKDIFIVNPLSKKISKFKYNYNIKGKLAKFYNARKIGIIISIKPGQYNLKKALELQKKLDKESYIFLCDEVNEKELENFGDIDYWVNTACLRIDFKGVVGIWDLE